MLTESIVNLRLPLESPQTVLRKPSGSPQKVLAKSSVSPSPRDRLDHLDIPNPPVLQTNNRANNYLNKTNAISANLFDFEKIKLLGNISVLVTFQFW